jgi:hypothetical protein
MTDHRSQYVITRPVASHHMGTIENLIPTWCRSVICIHGATDDDPIRYRAHRSEIKHVRRAICTAESTARVIMLLVLVKCHQNSVKLLEEVTQLRDLLKAEEALK